MFTSNEFTQFQLRQKDLQRQAERERQLNEVRQERENKRTRRQTKQNTLLSRIWVLF